MAAAPQPPRAWTTPGPLYGPPLTGSPQPVEKVGDRAGDVVRDDEVRAQAKLAAASLSDALAATMNLLGDQLGGLFKPSKDDGPAADIAASEPPAHDARQ